MRVLFVNHEEKQCGVYQFGKRVSDRAFDSEKSWFSYVEVSSLEQFKWHIERLSPELIVYNWYPITMGWLNQETIDEVRRLRIQQYVIYHDGNILQGMDKYLCFGADDNYYGNPDEHPLLDPNKIEILPRPLFKYDKELPNNDILTIGSFGFGFGFKGFDSITTIVNESFPDQKLRLRFHMPYAKYGDELGKSSRAVAKLCHELNDSSRVDLQITHDFRTDEEILDFLAGNDINFFHYNVGVHPGLSSVLDYALSVRRPLALNNSMMFRHVLSKVDLTFDSLEEVYLRGTTPLEKLYSEWSQENLTTKLEELFEWK